MVLLEIQYQHDCYPPQRPARSEVNTLELFQNCSFCEGEQEASDLRSHLEKFSVLYEKTLDSRKEPANIDRIFTRLYELSLVVFFLKIYSIEKT